jgi:hypothetical protein
MSHIKDSYYFPHDSNARRDPKVLALRSVYGMTGYGWYWAIIEMLREQPGFKLGLISKYAYKAIAMELECGEESAAKFIQDCIEEFGLFETDGEYFWSSSLLRRMEIKEEVSSKARQAALTRWSKNEEPNYNASAMLGQYTSNAGAMQVQCASSADATEEECGCNADAMRMQCERNADAMLGQCSGNASKVKESKENKIKKNKSKNKNIPAQGAENEKANTPKVQCADKAHTGKVQFAEYVSMTNAEHEKLVSTYGAANAARMIEKLDNYKGSTGKPYRNDYRTILSWVADEVLKNKREVATDKQSLSLGLLRELYEEEVAKGGAG